MRYSVVIPEGLNDNMKSHLVKRYSEDLGFALYSISTGKERISGLINEIVTPLKGERNLHGNVSFNPEYFDRVSKIALEKGGGICFIHSHPSPGWQKMSQDDINAEKMLAPRVKGLTGLPLLGMTLGSDGAWSARFWIKSKPKRYKREWCESVRVVGKKFSVTFNEELIPSPIFNEEFQRTISAWGENKQSILSSLKVGIVGVGSVGSQLAESLLRTGIQKVYLIDFDTIKRKNLDRLHSVSHKHVGFLKTDVYADLLNNFRLLPDQEIISAPFSIIEREGLETVEKTDKLTT